MRAVVVRHGHRIEQHVALGAHPEVAVEVHIAGLIEHGPGEQIGAM